MVEMETVVRWAAVEGPGAVMGAAFETPVTPLCGR